MCPLLSQDPPTTPQDDVPGQGAVREPGRGIPKSPPPRTSREECGEKRRSRSPRHRPSSSGHEERRGKRPAGVLASVPALPHARRGEKTFCPSAALGLRLLQVLHPLIPPQSGARQPPQRSLVPHHHHPLPPHHHHHLTTLHVSQIYLQLQGVASLSKNHPPSP